MSLFPRMKKNKLNFLSFQQPPFAECGANHRIKEYLTVPFSRPVTKTLERWKKCFIQNSLAS